MPNAKESSLEVTTASPLSRSLPIENATGEKLRALLFFWERTSPSLSAFTRFTKQFFFDTVPQLSAVEHAVRSMTVALAARQELLNCPADRLYYLSMVRSSAVKDTVNDLTQPGCSIVAILVCGLFFIGYECLQDPTDINPDTSVRHLGAGLRILEEHHATTLSSRRLPSSVTEVLEEYLEPVYLQMVMILSTSNNPIHTNRDLSMPYNNAKPPKLPPRFTDLVSARNTFLQIYRWHYLYRAEGNKSWTPTSSAFQTVRGLFIEWYTLIMAYSETLGEAGKDEVVRQKLRTMVSHWTLLMVGMVHSTATSNRNGIAGGAAGSPYLPHGGRLKTSVVDLMDPDVVTITFIVDARSLRLLEICDWTDEGLSGDPALRIRPLAEVRRLEDGSGRGVVRLRMGV